MRLHTTIILSLNALAVLALTGCSTDSAPAPAPLSSAALAERLLDEGDLGKGYTRTPQRPAQHDDVSVIGCPALDRLGSEAAVGGSLDFPRKAKASFTYAGSVDSEVAEELYSDTEPKLSKQVGRIFEAMTSCSSYQVLVGGTVVTVAAQEVAAPRLGDQRWSQVLTFSTGGRNQVVKQTAVRVGTVVMVLSGSPALVDAHVEKAVGRARAEL